MMSDDTLLQMLLALERAALDRWSKGDTVGYTTSMNDAVTYFDHVTPGLLQGTEAVRKHVSAFQGKFTIPRYEIVHPVIHHSGDLAVLAFNWDPYDAEGRLIIRWNATSVYRRVGGAWRMVHAQWAKAATG
jgi:hypothetical protein